MSFHNLKVQALKLPNQERQALCNALTQSLQDIDSGERWQFLVSRPHAWRRQLYIKGRKLRAATVWQDMLTNQMTVEEAAENWGLPVAAIEEAVQYCEMNQALLQLEAAEELLSLRSAGVGIEPVSTH
ncbi:MAG: hypothetical protein F6J87_00915 [Spirulina sp. SIO3F2]|nr:hypothetical protein [Spirulina sp. SIO3F2]